MPSSKIEDSKNAEPWVLPLSGRLLGSHSGASQAPAHRLSVCLSPGWKEDRRHSQGVAHRMSKSRTRRLLIHDLRRCAARNLSRAGVFEVVAMRMTGHKTPSMYRRCRIIDENELREAQEKMQRHLNATQETRVVIGRT